ncbi:MAG: helix-turn-helix domain-containing protein [Treponema sp.]|jgi:cytoskeletal protein RodZ|nr:helix-turn-helix domain-containing protein [Treponema sp.]
MESLGEKLKTAREGKGLDYDQASKDTKIAVRYLKALEGEDFSGFPGETYLTGFLRNYGSYLDLDVQELLGLYRALKIQEQPIPVDQLLRHPSLAPKIAVGAALVILALGIVGGGIYFIMTHSPRPGIAAPVPRAPVEYTMSGDSFEHRFYRGDTILIPTGGDGQNLLKLELQSLEEAVTIRTPGGPIMLDLSQEANISLDNNEISGLLISAVDYVKNNADMGVLLHFELKSASTLAAAPNIELIETTGVAGQSASTVIFSSPNPYPFTLQSNFQNYCMFRWEILMERDRRDRNERYFQRSDELNIQAQNGIRIWASNAQAAKFMVIGGGRSVPVEIGGAGEVVVADIRWVRDEENRYRLIVARVEA